MCSLVQLTINYDGDLFFGKFLFAGTACSRYCLRVMVVLKLVLVARVGKARNYLSVAQKSFS